MHEREPLNGGDADAQSCEGSGAGRDGVEFDVTHRHAAIAKQRRDLPGQPRGVGARTVTGALFDDTAAADERDAPGASGRVEGDYQHRGWLVATSNGPWNKLVCICHGPRARRLPCVNPSATSSSTATPSCSSGC